MQRTWKTFEMHTTLWLDVIERHHYRPRRQDADVNIDYKGIMCRIMD
jgi:hypothetical protein